MKKKWIATIAVLLPVILAGCAAAGPESIGAQPPITLNEADNIALDHAGLPQAPAPESLSYYEVNDGVPVYEVEFHADGWEYNYEIHAETGAILSADKEKEQATKPAATEPAATEPAPTVSAEKLTAKEAEDIALNHAGLKRKNVRFDRTEPDMDDGVPVYEIEFRADGWEYSYEIHAETGKILSSEKDRDD